MVRFRRLLCWLQACSRLLQVKKFLESPETQTILKELNAVHWKLSVEPNDDYSQGRVVLTIYIDNNRWQKEVQKHGGEIITHCHLSGELMSRLRREFGFGTWLWVDVFPVNILKE